MTRTAWILLLLLVGSNLLWFIVGDDEPAATQATRDTLSEADRARLRAELRASEGVGERMGASPGLAAAPATRAEDVVTGTSGPDAPASGAEDLDVAEAKRAARRKHQADVLEQIKATLRKVMQVEDPALRREGLAELGAGLGSTDPLLVEYSLSALHSMRVEGVDRGVFRGQVLDLLDSENPGVRRAALYALHSTGVQSGDVQRALAGVDDDSPLVRQHVARVLKLYGGGRLDGEAQRVVATLLSDEQRDVRRGTLRALDGVTLDTPAEKALIALAERPEDRLEAVQHGLSRLEDKSRPVIDALFEHLADDEGRVRLAAHQGLQKGIPDAQQPYVARRYADHLTKFVNPKSHQQALTLIAKFGDASLVPQVERFAENELVDTRVREMAAKVAEHLRAK